MTTLTIAPGCKRMIRLHTTAIYGVPKYCQRNTSILLWNQLVEAMLAVYIKKSTSKYLTWGRMLGVLTVLVIGVAVEAAAVRGSSGFTTFSATRQAIVR